jgi:hypothetical protein
MGTHHRILRILLPATVAWLVLAAPPIEAGIAPSAAVARTAANRAPRAQDASYQRLIDAANAVVGVKVKALPNARSNESLGQERVGSGVLIGKDSLVLTIGYLILEADHMRRHGVWVPAFAGTT